ncbi:hypothetical protein LK994_06320 [Ferruginibacter lapsinanis]|uniref:hypothetical protein n=1 Tax=Ferruginibacter lapsinanis TaxID=563172 RepID=UPI001E4B0902|nr:hypothetical protein [Ferruginibacter lapsinanis]UEG51089.1 hypothetical protein LK994_06320 [Ferruginibacter lapsinanis]
MKKFILVSLSLLFINVFTKAQSTVGSVAFDKVNQSAVIGEFAFEENTTAEAIKAKFKSLGYSSKSSKGFDVYKGVKLAELGPDTYDLYVKVDRKSKKERDRSVVYLLITKGYDNFASEATDATLFANAKTFVNNLVVNIVATDLEKQIEEQENAVKKAEKKYNNAVDDGNNLEKKKRQLEQDIIDNQKDQANKKSEAEAQRQILETLKGKRKS